MSASIGPDTEADRFRLARTGAYTWRGACIGQMADIEYRLGCLLLLTIGHPAYPGKPGTLHLGGQKFERLRQLMLQDGPVRTAVPSGAAILDAYAQFDDLRSYLAHAALELSETEKGVMYWSFRLLRFSSGSATHSVLTMTDAEARNARRALSNTGRAVVAMFDRIEAALTSPAKPIAAYPAPIATGSYSLSVSSPAATAVTPAAARSRS